MLHPLMPIHWYPIAYIAPPAHAGYTLSRLYTLTVSKHNWRYLLSSSFISSSALTTYDFGTTQLPSPQSSSQKFHDASPHSETQVTRWHLDLEYGSHIRDLIYSSASSRFSLQLALLFMYCPKEFSQHAALAVGPPKSIRMGHDGISRWRIGV